MSLNKLLKTVRSCTICQPELPHEANPVLSISDNSKILVIGQAPGRKVHESGIPWDDMSGKRLRNWLGVDSPTFYDTSLFGIMPMGFCYPGTGKSGDLPPRKECAAKWHGDITSKLKNVELTLLIGQYAQRYYLGPAHYKTLTETVKNYRQFLPKYIPLPHPSPRNGIWLKKNSWFEREVVPEMQAIVQSIRAKQTA